VVRATQRYTIQIIDADQEIDAADAWIDGERDRLAALTSAKVVRESAVEIDGARGRDIELARWGRVVRSRVLVQGNRVYVVTASAGAWGPDQERFMGSFRVRGKE
jgi:hypothetical protein